ncbi:MAG: hypothetical protein EBS24_04555 [Chitinophagia bacterium]|nr:hypothetical protein [Chitinophagia bacterium]
MSANTIPAYLLFKLIFSFFMAVDLQGQDTQYDDEGFEIFMYQDGDTTYTMKKYYMAFLKRGDKTSVDDEERMRIQQAHLDHMSHLAEQDKICIAGPFGDDTDLRGIVIYSAKSMEEARSYADSDPAVKAGILKIDIHPWWAAKGSKLY